MAKTIALNWRDYLKKKIYGIVGMPSTQEDPNNPNKMFVNNLQDIQDTKLREYRAWYSGDSDQLLNFYTQADAITYNTEPYYDRNKQSYFWAVSSTEGDIKRTHSGQPRNIVDTLVNICGYPKFTTNHDELTEILEETLKENKFKRMFLQEQLPLTLVEGWGCYRVDWDVAISNRPIIRYYRADACEFIYEGNRIVAIIFKDYYYGEKGEKYILLETRRIKKEYNELTNTYIPCLYIEKEVFVYGEGSGYAPASLKDIPQLKDIKPKISVSNFRHLLAVPCIIYMDNESENAGRSIFTGKIDLFDDLDQCLSQSSNTVRRSTTREYFNSNYLERDPNTGLPIQPKAFDRKYTMYAGGRDANGGMQGDPVQVTQPNLNFTQYDGEAQHILLECIAGIMSPATLGIDIAKKDNADAQREKEKVTIFTRETVIAEEMEILEELGKNIFYANELMHKGEVTAKDYDVSVKFKEFMSFESRLDLLLTQYNADVITPKMFVEDLYGDSKTEQEKQELIDYMEAKADAALNAGFGSDQLGMMGAQMGGMTNNPLDAALAGAGMAMDPSQTIAAESPTGEVPEAMDGQYK